ncbi:MAG: ABC transporter permease [Clostridia bacterium]|nr:ABC transporter permease [Clostridia bacterium]
MSNILNRFRKRNIQTNFYHFALVIFVIAVSVCLISGLIINYLTLSRSVNKFFNDSKLPNMWIESNQITNEDEAYLSSKFEFDKRYKFDSSFKTGSSEYFGTFLVSGGDVSTPYITKGEREKGCYVDAKYAEKYRFGLNHSKIALNYELNGTTKRIEFKIVGLISLAEDLIIDDKPTIFIDENVFLETLKTYFTGIENADLSILNYNEILISSNVSTQDKLDLQNYYENSSSKIINIQEKENLPSLIALNKEIEIARNMLWIFPIIFVLISILVVISAISQMTLKERYNIGLLKSIGISNKQILMNYCGYGSFVGFLGAVLGFLLSPLIIPNMTFETYDKLYNLPRDEMKLTCPALLIVFVIIISILICYFTALFVCLNLTQKTPKECMSKMMKTNLKSRQKKNKLPAIINAPLRNMKLNLSRTIMSVFGVAGSSLLMLLGFGVEKIIINNAENKKFYSVGIFSKIFKGFSIALLMLTIIVLIIQIFKERLKEMSMRRVHGEDYVKIWLSVLLEMVFIGLVGYIISILFSGPAMLLNLHIFGINEYLAINFLSFLKVFLIIFSIILISASVGLLKIYKLKLSESIKFSE